MTKVKTKGLKQISPTAKHDAGVEIELKDPTTSEGLGMFITVMGKESSVFRAYSRKVANKALSERAKIANGQKVKTQTIEDIEAQSIALCAACTKSWRSVVWDEDDGELPFSEENALMIYAEPFIRNQVDEAINDVSAFTMG